MRAPSNHSDDVGKARALLSEAMSASSRSPRPAHRQPLLCGIVACGGALGASLRYLIGQWWPHGSLPWPVLLLNSAGALVLGALLEALSKSGPDVGGRRRLRLFLGTGFCGAFTTYSTFAGDVFTLSREHVLTGIAWGSVQLVAGFACALLGALVGARLTSASGETPS